MNESPCPFAVQVHFLLLLSGCIFWWSLFFSLFRIHFSFARRTHFVSLSMCCMIGWRRTVHFVIIWHLAWLTFFSSVMPHVKAYSKHIVPSRHFLNGYAGIYYIDTWSMLVQYVWFGIEWKKYTWFVFNTYWTCIVVRFIVFKFIIIIFLFR